MLVQAPAGETPDPESTPAATPAAAPASEASASLEVFVYAKESLIPQPELRVSAWCEACDLPPAFSTTEPGGLVRFEGLVAGRYRVVVYSEAGAEELELELAEGSAQRVEVGVARDPYRPRDEAERPAYEGPRSRGRASFELPLAIGGVLTIAAGGMAVGAVVEATVPRCTAGVCDGGPRPRMIRGLALGAGLTAAAALPALIVGGVRLRRWRYGVSAGPQGASISLRGRF